MRNVLVVAALALVACDDGVVVEISLGTTGATRVELYLASAGCMGTPCMGVQPEVAFERLGGTVYFRDGDKRELRDVGDGPALFRLEPGETEHVKRVLAVGYDGPNANRAVGYALFDEGVVTLDGPRRYLATLEPAKNAPPEGDGAFVYHWESPTTSCVVVEKRSGATVDRVSIVPADDPDCDGITDLECPGGETIYEWQSPPSHELAEQSCSARFPTGNGETCRLGGGCIDGQPDESSCVASRYCLPDKACDCAFADLACAQQNAEAIFTSVRLECHMQLGLDGQPCATRLYKLDLSRVLVNNISIAGSTILALLRPDGTPAMPQDAGAVAELQNGAKLVLETGPTLNGIPIRLETGPMVMNQPGEPFTLPPEAALLFTQLANEHVLIVPTVFIFEAKDAGCEQVDTTCDIVGTAGVADGMWNCVAP